MSEVTLKTISQIAEHVQNANHGFGAIEGCLSLFLQVRKGSAPIGLAEFWLYISRHNKQARLFLFNENDFVFLLVRKANGVRVLPAGVNGTFDLLGTSEDSLRLIYSRLLGAFANVLGQKMRMQIQVLEFKGLTVHHAMLNVRIVLNENEKGSTGFMRSTS